MGHGELLHQIVADAAAVVPDRPAVIAEDGTVTTFAQFDRSITAAAGWIASRTTRGDRVAVIADNSPDYATLYYAAPRAGCILVLINQRLKTAVAEDERAAMVAEIRRIATPFGFSVETLLPMNSNNCRSTARSCGKTRTPACPTMI